MIFTKNLTSKANAIKNKISKLRHKVINIPLCISFLPPINKAKRE
jgi:hypothetical protein